MSSPFASSPSFWLRNCGLRNFRRFPTMDLEFERDVTVLVGSNAGGKTAILDALAIVLSAYVGAFDTGRRFGFQRTDAHVKTVGRARTQEQQFPVVAEVLMDINDEPTWARRELRGAASRTTSGEAHELRHLAKTLQHEVRAGATDSPSDRVLRHRAGCKNCQKVGRFRDHGSRATQCLDPAPTYPRGMATWIRWAYLTRLQKPSQGSEETSVLALAVLENLAIVASRVLRIRVKSRSRRWNARKFATTSKTTRSLRIAFGARATGEIASDVLERRSIRWSRGRLGARTAILNPHLGSDAHAQTPGVVLIDEVDLHLHPRWQQQVLLQTRDAFPRVQFIVTTHSPQVLSTVEGRSIRQPGSSQ